MIIAQLSIAPIGKDVSVSRYVKIALDVLKNSNIKFATNAMATVIETDTIETLFQVVTQVHHAVMDAGPKRVITELKIDDRQDKNATIESKLRSLR
jgi:uncharacterized protein (TIGR00106 family)